MDKKLNGQEVRRIRPEKSASTDSLAVREERAAICAMIDQMIQQKRDNRSLVISLDFLKDCIQQRGR